MFVVVRVLIYVTFMVLLDVYVLFERTKFVPDIAIVAVPLVPKLVTFAVVDEAIVIVVADPGEPVPAPLDGIPAAPGRAIIKPDAVEFVILIAPAAPPFPVVLVPPLLFAPAPP